MPRTRGSSTLRVPYRIPTLGALVAFALDHSKHVALVDKKHSGRESMVR